ncbi:MAG TPA: peptidoglycan-binding domain-containing protein [Beijerinckiaceae bacterium]
MREALAARSTRDFVAAGPARRKTGRSEARWHALWRAPLRFALQRPGTVLGGALIAGAAGLVTVNALSSQTMRHPAPLFRKAEPVRPPEAQPRAARPAQAPAQAAPAQSATVPPKAVQPQASARDPIADVLRGQEAPAQAPARPPGPPAKPSREALNELIRAGETASLRLEPQKPVAAAQRALTKLGYGPLKADGVMGAGTRQALERFERDRKLAVTGELGARTSRELGTAAGFAIE